jgi:hypothetical protein
MSGATNRIISVITTVPANPPTIDLTRLGFMHGSPFIAGKVRGVFGKGSCSRGHDRLLLAPERMFHGPLDSA